MDRIIYSNGTATVTVPANQKIAIYTNGTAVVRRVVGYPNIPNSDSVLTTVVGGLYTSSAFTAATTLIIEGNAAITRYSVGTAPIIDEKSSFQIQSAPTALNATGNLTVAAILGGIVTSTSAAAVTATLSTGSLFDNGTLLSVGDSVNWSIINTGPNAVTVTAATGHTIVGAAAVATLTSGSFRTLKTAANTFVTYRIS